MPRPFNGPTWRWISDKLPGRCSIIDAFGDGQAIKITEPKAAGDGRGYWLLTDDTQVPDAHPLDRSETLRLGLYGDSEANQVIFYPGTCQQAVRIIQSLDSAAFWGAP